MIYLLIYLNDKFLVLVMRIIYRYLMFFFFFTMIVYIYTGNIYIDNRDDADIDNMSNDI